MPRRGVSATDTVIGKRLRSLRKSRGISQTDIGKVLGVKFQQIQKFELGVNRLSASQLFELARHFGVPITRFFPSSNGKGSGRAAPQPSPEALSSLEFVASTQGLAFMRALASLDNLQRDCLAEYVKALAKKTTKP